MNKQERMEKALNLYKKLENLIIQLWQRWQDEKEYETIDDYAVSIKPEIEAIGGIFIKMTKLPFGFIYKLNDATYQIKITKTKYEYKRIA